MSIMYCDGGISPPRICFVIDDDATILPLTAETSHNENEYLAVVRGMEHLALYQGNLLIRSDSQLVIRQLQGKYKIKQERLRPYYQRVKHLERMRRESGFTVDYEWIPRENNKAGIVLEHGSLSPRLNNKLKARHLLKDHTTITANGYMDFMKVLRQEVCVSKAATAKYDKAKYNLQVSFE